MKQGALLLGAPPAPPVWLHSVDLPSLCEDKLACHGLLSWLIPGIGLGQHFFFGLCKSLPLTTELVNNEVGTSNLLRKQLASGLEVPDGAVETLFEVCSCGVGDDDTFMNVNTLYVSAFPLVSSFGCPFFRQYPQNDTPEFALLKASAWFSSRLEKQSGQFE